MAGFIVLSGALLRKFEVSASVIPTTCSPMRCDINVQMRDDRML